MKFTKKMPQTDNEFSEMLLKSGWNKIREPHTMGAAILASLPFAGLSLFLTYFVIYPFHNLLTPIQQFMADGLSFSINPLKIFSVLAALYFYVIIHEFLHGIIIPNFYKSNKTFWGLTVLGGFVVTTEELSKKRFILISILPYLALTVGTTIILGFLGALSNLMLFLIIINALGSCVDFLNIALIAFQVPNGSKIINNGFETFYK